MRSLTLNEKITIKGKINFSCPNGKPEDYLFWFNYIHGVSIAYAFKPFPQKNRHTKRANYCLLKPQNAEVTV